MAFPYSPEAVEKSPEDARSQILDIIKKLGMPGLYQCTKSSTVATRVQCTNGAIATFEWELESLKRDPFAAIVAEIIEFMKNFMGTMPDYAAKLKKFRSAVLAIEVKSGVPQASTTFSSNNPTHNGLVGEIADTFSERLGASADDHLRAEEIRGGDLQQRMAGELVMLRANVKTLTAELDRLQKYAAAQDKEHWREVEAQTKISNLKIRELDDANRELRVSLQKALWANEDLKRQNSPRQAHSAEQPQVMILSGPLSTIGMTIEEVTALRARYSDDTAFRKNLTRTAQARVHPDVITANLDNIHDPYLQQQIKFLQDERFKNIENAVDEIMEQLRVGKLKNKWKHK